MSMRRCCRAMATREECGELRDMLDFTLHTWDVIEALGLKDPILVGHSMGGMIAAEMAAVAPHDVSRLGAHRPAGLWLDAHPIPDLFALHAVRICRNLLFHDVGSGHATAHRRRGLRRSGMAQGLSRHQCAAAGHGGKNPVPDSRPRSGGPALPHQGEDTLDLGRQRQADPAGLCPGLQEGDPGRRTRR